MLIGHTCTHNHTPFFFFFKSRAPEQSCFPIVSLWLCSVSEGVLTVAEVLHTDSDADFVPLATLSDYRQVGPHSDSTSSGVGGGGVDFSAGLEV